MSGKVARAEEGTAWDWGTLLSSPALPMAFCPGTGPPCRRGHSRTAPPRLSLVLAIPPQVGIPIPALLGPLGSVTVEGRWVNKVFIPTPWMGVGGNGLKSGTSSLLKHEHCRSCHCNTKLSMPNIYLTWKLWWTKNPAVHKGQMKQ